MTVPLLLAALLLACLALSANATRMASFSPRIIGESRVNSNKKVVHNARADVIAAVLPGNAMVTGTITQGFLNIISIYNNVILARFALSWFPQLVTQFPILKPVFTVTEPYLGVFRRQIPPIAGFDISAIPALFVLDIISQVRCTWLYRNHTDRL